jgi:pantoate--beta-alanine ligase
METVTTIAALRARLDAVRSRDGSVGAVPTMGYLHDGHASLMRAAARDCDAVAASIFVNPLQFAAHEDLGTYPRDLERDTTVAEANGVDVLFTPSLEEMYPRPVATTVSVAGVSETMEGASRPTHFAGVATVVAKLCNLFGRCRMYFGEKDYQQLAVVRRMVEDLSFPVEVVGCPIVREPDGLAMSSRNVYLDPAQRAAAPVLHRALQAGAEAVEAGVRDAGAVVALVARLVASEPQAELDYVELRDPSTLEPVAEVDGEARLLVAARFGATRLLDNVAVRP